MTASGVNGSGSWARPGARALTLLATPLNSTVLRQLSDGSKRLAELRRECGSPAQTTLRSHLKELNEVGAIDRCRGDSFPGVGRCELATAGRELLFVADALERWLEGAPKGPLQFGSSGAKAATKALVEGWSSTMLRALAARPLSLTELDGIIATLSYPSLERRLSAMRLAGQVERCSGNGRGTPYAVTDWLRRGVAPLAAATSWERRNLPERTPAITRLDVEAGLLLAVPLLQVPADLSGACRLAVEVSNGRGRSLAGVMVEVADGSLASCDTRLEGHPDAWALGEPSAWLRAVIEQDTGHLELGGNSGLAQALLDGLHGALFGAPVRS